MARPPRRNDAIPIGNQVARMAISFPDLRAHRGWHKGICVWEGQLRPTEASRSYRVRIEYRVGSPPRVTVLSPPLRPEAPHRFRSGRLCLYHPDDRSWYPGQYVADTIVPWTAEWLLFYEVWQDTGNWLGPEVLHDGEKREA